MLKKKYKGKEHFRNGIKVIENYKCFLLFFRFNSKIITITNENLMIMIAKALHDKIHCMRFYFSVLYKRLSRLL